jgi:hypothetical protein
MRRDLSRAVLSYIHPAVELEILVKTSVGIAFLSSEA